MSLILVDFHSSVLDMDQSVYVILPEEKRDSEVPYFSSSRPALPERFAALYLLHGTSQDHSEWQRFTAIERYANQKGMAVVMPNAQLSAYTDMVYGEAWQRYIALELPQLVEKWFPIHSCREARSICGLSMGGYGATKIGLKFPHRYAAIGSLSNGNHAYKRVLDASPTRSDAMPNQLIDERHLFCWGLPLGETPMGTAEDLYQLARDGIAAGGPLPAVFHMVGTADRNIGPARHMCQFFRSLEEDPYRYTYFEEEMGNHTWKDWDRWIEIFLQWLRIPNNDFAERAGRDDAHQDK